MLDKLIAVLADGAFHSGSDIGRQLGMSRSAVWKHMRRLEELGIELYSVKGRGYRIPGGLDLLDASVLQQRLAAIAGLSEIEVVTEIDSTNIRALERLQQGVKGGLYTAEFQHGGRGRRGRQWLSPLASSLCFTLAWRFNSGAAALEGLSLAVGVALQRALLRLQVPGVCLKWPNDLLVDQQKLAGILIELSGDAAGECQVAIGVGLNVRLPDTLIEALDQPATDLGRLGFGGSRTELLAVLVSELVEVLEAFERGGFAPLRADWEAANAFAGRPVRLTSGSHSYEGVCLGVTDQGGLRLQMAAGEEVFHGGEMSVRINEPA